MDFKSHIRTGYEIRREKSIPDSKSNTRRQWKSLCCHIRIWILLKCFSCHTLNEHYQVQEWFQKSLRISSDLPALKFMVNTNRKWQTHLRFSNKCTAPEVWLSCHGNMETSDLCRELPKSYEEFARNRRRRWGCFEQMEQFWMHWFKKILRSFTWRFYSNSGTQYGPLSTARISKPLIAESGVSREDCQVWPLKNGVELLPGSHNRAFL